jgi:hypothetical protein
MKIIIALLLLLCLIPSQVFGMGSLVLALFSFVPSMISKSEYIEKVMEKRAIVKYSKILHKIDEANENLKNAVSNYDYKKVTKIIDMANEKKFPLDLDRLYMRNKLVPNKKRFLELQELRLAIDEVDRLTPILYTIVGVSEDSGRKEDRILTYKALIAGGADPILSYISHDRYRFYPLIQAIDENDFEFVQLCFRPDQPPAISKRAMQHALSIKGKDKYMNKKIVKFLIKNGITLEMVDNIHKKDYKIHADEVEQQRWQNGLLNKKIFNDFEIKYK